MAEDGRPHQLILFDIDGTLLHTGGAGGRAMSRAFAEVCRVENGFDGVSLPGRTDPLILADAMRQAGVADRDDLVDAFRAVYCRCLADELARPSKVARVLPGVPELLRALSTRDATTSALLTGNYSPAARLKLEHFGLWQWFDFGAFGEDAADRDGLVRVAIARGRERGMPSVGPADVVVLGDTPLDVRCGQANGARTIAVATGNFDVSSLEPAGPDAVLTDLSDTRAVIELLDRWRVSGAASPDADARAG